MHKANAGRSEIGFDSMVGFVQAWAAGSSVINARGAIVFFDSTLAPWLRRYASAYPNEVNDCLESINKAASQA
jgi:hypothetical protein